MQEPEWALEKLKGLAARIVDLQYENEQLKTIGTADDFVKRLVEETKTMFVVSREKADIVRQVLLKMGKTAEQQELADWIIGKPTPPKIIQNISGSQVFNGNITDSEFICVVFPETPARQQAFLLECVV